MGAFDGAHIESVTSLDVIKLKHNGWDVDRTRLTNIEDPVVEQDAVTLKYANDKYLNKSIGGSILGGINMNHNNLFGLQNPPTFDSSAVSLAYFISHVYNQLSETLLWEYATIHGTAFYRLDRGISSEVVVDPTTRNVSKLYELCLILENVRYLKL